MIYFAWLNIMMLKVKFLWGGRVINVPHAPAKNFRANIANAWFPMYKHGELESAKPLITPCACARGEVISCVCRLS